MTPRPDIFTLALDMLLRPRRYAAFLAASRVNIAVAMAAALVWSSAGLAFVTLVLGQLIPLGTIGLIGALVYAPMLAIALGGLFLIVSSAILPSGIAPWFWMTRNLVAITPVMALLLGVGMSSAIGRLPHSMEEAAGLFLLILVGAWLGGGLTVILVLRQEYRESAPVRLVLGIGAAMISALLWYSAPLRNSEAVLLALVLLGTSVGVTRPLSWLWQSLLSIGLALAAWLGAPALSLARRHPLFFDELGLLPLPGIVSLLARACTADLEEGAKLLITTAHHPAYGGVAERVIRRLVESGRQAHPVLFYLSSQPDGAALLADIADRSSRLSPIIVAYAMLAHVHDQAAWGTVAADARQRLSHYATLPGGAALLSLLDAATGILGADRYATARETLRQTPPPQGVESDPLWEALDALLQTARNETAEGISNDWQPAVGTALDLLDGWPAALLAAMAEHMAFLSQHETAGGAL